MKIRWYHLEVIGCTNMLRLKASRGELKAEMSEIKDLGCSSYIRGNVMEILKKKRRRILRGIHLQHSCRKRKGGDTLKLPTPIMEVIWLNKLKSSVKLKQLRFNNWKTRKSLWNQRIMNNGRKKRKKGIRQMCWVQGDQEDNCLSWFWNKGKVQSALNRL